MLAGFFARIPYLIVMDIVAENFEVTTVPKGKAVLEESGRGGPSLASTTPVVDALSASFAQPSLAQTLKPASSPLNPVVPDKLRSLSAGIVVTPPATLTGPSRTTDSGSAATSVALDGSPMVSGRTLASTPSVPVSPSSPKSSTSLPCDDALGLVVVLEPHPPQSPSPSKPWSSSVAGQGDAATMDDASLKRHTLLSPTITSNQQRSFNPSTGPIPRPPSIDCTLAALPDPRVKDDAAASVAEAILPLSSLAPLAEPQTLIVSSSSSQGERQSSPPSQGERQSSPPSQGERQSSPLQTSDIPSARTVALPSSLTTDAQSCSPIDTLDHNSKYRYRSIMSYSTTTAHAITTTTTSVSRSTTNPSSPVSSSIAPVSLAFGASESSNVTDDHHLPALSSDPPVSKTETETETETLINFRSMGLPSSVTLQPDDHGYHHHQPAALSLPSVVPSVPSSNLTEHVHESSSLETLTSFPSVLKNSNGTKRPRPEDEEEEDQEVEGGHLSKKPRECKAGNPNCGLVAGVSIMLRDGMCLPCEICCTEDGFCRECKCILCCKIIAPTEENFVRCLHRPTGEPGLCGHAAHLPCAVHMEMAGVVKKKNLDMEYLCRRCDNKTDLRESVALLLEAFGNIEQRSRAEMSLELTLELMRGTERGGSGAKVLESLVQSALIKVRNGADITEVYKELKDQGTAADAARQNQTLVRTPSNVEDLTQQPSSIVEDLTQQPSSNVSDLTQQPSSNVEDLTQQPSSNAEDLTQQPEASLDQWLQEGSPSSHPSPGTPSSFTSRLKSTPSVTSGHRNTGPDIADSRDGDGGVKHSPASETADQYITHSNALPEVESNSNYASKQLGGKASARNGQRSSHIVRAGSSNFNSDLKAVSDRRMAKGSSQLAKSSKRAVGETVSEDRINVSQSVERGSNFTTQKQKGQSSSVRDCGAGEVCRACGGSGSVQPQAIMLSCGDREPGPSDNSNKKKKRRVDSRRDAVVSSHGGGNDNARRDFSVNSHLDATANIARCHASIVDAAPRASENSVSSAGVEACDDIGIRRTINSRDSNVGECRENNAGGRLGIKMVGDFHDVNVRDCRYNNMSNRCDNIGDDLRHVKVADRCTVNMADGNLGDANNAEARRDRETNADIEAASRHGEVFGINLNLMADECDQHTEEALQQLKEAQDEEFELVKERLVAQKTSVLENYRLLEVARVRFSDEPEITSVTAMRAFDDLLVKLAEQYTTTMQEKQNFRKMLNIGRGFGQASAELRRKFYDEETAD